jgi:hypothetical protein
MKTFLTAAILGLTGLAGAASADAQDVRKYRNDRDDRRIDRRHRDREHGRRHRDVRPRHESVRVERYWIPARTTSVFAGYDPCGRPIYRTVCVPGHWATRPICD